MKRILLSVFAAAITAAWVVPASAADISFSGQYRVRGEFRENADFVTAPDNTSFIDQRVRLTANAQATEDTSVKITLQDSRRWGDFLSGPPGGGGPGLTDSLNNVLDLHESYVQINNLFDTPLSAKVGRQTLVYGDQRLVGAFDWSNNARSFDAIKLAYKSDMADVDFFISKINEASSDFFGSNGDNDQDFYGLYATVKQVPNNTIDAYVFLLRDGSTTQMISNGTGPGVVSGVQNLWTYGARLKGNLENIGLDYTGELALQSGSIPSTIPAGDADVSGLAYALKGGYTLPAGMKVRIGAEYVYASGDSDPANNEIETFSNLFPTNHGHMGFMDQQGWRNVSAWSVNAKANINEQLSAYIAYWSFSLAEKEDAWYGAGNWNNVPGGLRAPNPLNAEDEVGSEIDLVATYKYNEAVSLQGGYGYFSAGNFITTQTAPNSEDTQHWAYLMLTANF